MTCSGMHNHDCAYAGESAAAAYAAVAAAEVRHRQRACETKSRMCSFTKNVLSYHRMCSESARVRQSARWGRRGCRGRREKREKEREGRGVCKNLPMIGVHELLPMSMSGAHELLPMIGVHELLPMSMSLFWRARTRLGVSQCL